MKNQFWYFEFYTSKNQCDSLSSLMATLKTMTLKRFLKHGFSFFHLMHPFYFESRWMWNFGCLIKKNPHSAYNRCFEFKCEKSKSWREELVFKTILSVESILSQFFIQFEFSCVFLTDQISMCFLFHSTYGDPEHDLFKNRSMTSPWKTN